MTTHRSRSYQAAEVQAGAPESETLRKKKKKGCSVQSDVELGIRERDCYRQIITSDRINQNQKVISFFPAVNFDDTTSSLSQ